jgi:hypothetical protein
MAIYNLNQSVLNPMHVTYERPYLPLHVLHTTKAKHQTHHTNCEASHLPLPPYDTTVSSNGHADTLS